MKPPTHQAVSALQTIHARTQLVLKFTMYMSQSCYNEYNIAYGNNDDCMKKKPAKKASALKVYSNLSRKRKTKKDTKARERAEYLASLPKHPVKRFFYRLHPKRLAKYWFSKRGALMALKLFGVFLLFSALVVGAVFAYYRKDIDAIRPGKIAERVQTTVTKYYDRNGVLLWEDKGDGDYRLTVKSEDISDYMKNATIAIEDTDFYEHGGVSPTGILRSVFNNASGGYTQGGSTLTQQLVKQVFLADEAGKRGIDGVPRKIKEVILAIEVERMYNKDQILNLYLNESPYGGRRNGVESAAQTYFGKPAAKLNLAESALIASIPNYPSLYNPYNTAGHEALIARQHLVLDNMVDQGFISQEEADTAKKVAILDTVRPLADQLKDIKAPHFVLMVRSQLENELGKATVGKGGLVVKTTLDYRIQKKLEQAMDRMFDSSIPASAGFTNGAATVEDVKTGQIVALMGSRDFQYPGFGQDNAAMAYIQPGSTIKPLVYAGLFNNHGAEAQNFGSGSILADDTGMDSIYGAKLKNWDNRHMGSINLRRSLALSRNIPAVKAMYVNGVEPTLNLIRDMGDKSYCTQGVEAQAGLAASIGGCGAKQVEHVNAISTLAREGTYKPYSTVLEVKNSQGDTLVKFKDESKQVVDPQSAYIVSDILSDDNARAGLYGRNFYGLSVPGVKTAAKTGTSDLGGDPKDIWVVSYSPVLAMAAWLGNPDTRVLVDGNSSLPAQIIGDVMEYAHKDVYAKDGRWKSGDWFAEPKGIQHIGGELFPSYYNKSQAQSQNKLVFDKVSRKRATDCTPAGAKIEISVLAYTDPVSKKKTYLATDGYDPTKSDDAHKCGEATPTISVTTDGNTIDVTYIKGKFALNNVSVKVNGQSVSDFAVSSSGTRTIDVPAGAGDSFSVNATVTDEGYYTGSGSTTWSD